MLLKDHLFTRPIYLNYPLLDRPLISTSEYSHPNGVAVFFFGVERFESKSHTPVACASSSAHTGGFLYFFSASPASGKEMHANLSISAIKKKLPVQLLFLWRRWSFIRFAQFCWEGITNPLPNPPHAKRGRPLRAKRGFESKSHTPVACA